MPDFLLEIYSEEIPARWQRGAANGLLNGLIAEIETYGIEVTTASSFVTPHRLCFDLRCLPEISPVQVTTRRGPRVGAPQKAVEGFVRSVGIDIEKLDIRQAAKGAFYFAEIETPGHRLLDILNDTVPKVMAEFRWPKSMRWGTDSFRWTRPIRSILGLVVNENETHVLDFSVANDVSAGNMTRGHSLMAPGEIEVISFDDYRRQLLERFVVLDSFEREKRILEGATALAEAEGLELVEDSELLEEISGLVEWPVPMMEKIDPKFLSLPQEILLTSMRSHQKYLAIKSPDTKQISHFVVVANCEEADEDRTILKGNQLVLTARLEDAAFVWGKDVQRVAKRDGFDGMRRQLNAMSYHQQLGSLGDKVNRLTNLSVDIAEWLNWDVERVRQTARVVKNDLVSETVGEFPELQGVIGRHLATSLGMPNQIAAACAEHYLPAGPKDRVPTESTSVAVGLADRIDQLIGFFAIGEAPTGSKDPFALRRSALGVIRLCIDNDLRIPLRQILKKSCHEYASLALPKFTERSIDWDQVTSAVMEFVHERLSVHSSSMGTRQDVLKACLATQEADDLTLLVRRAAALGHILETNDGERLLHGFRRANNILSIEFGERDFLSLPEPLESLALEPSEKALFKGLAKANQDIKNAIENERLQDAMRAMARLSTPIDHLFEEVRVQTDDPALRDNRLRLLAAVCRATGLMADLRKIETST